MLAPLLTTTDKDNYNIYLEQKITAVTAMLKDRVLDTPHGSVCGLADISPEIHASIPEHYRMRAEFAVFRHEDNSFDYVMFEKNGKEKKRIIIKEFPGCTVAINRAMEMLRRFTFKERLTELTQGLFEADFLCNTEGDTVISLVYHRKADEAEWMKQADQLRTLMRNEGLSCSVLCRSRKQFLKCGDDFVTESFSVCGRQVKLKQVEGTFSQPNATACQAMLEFAVSCTPAGKAHDLIELYCGSGTFTVTLAPYFRKVFATEVSRIPTLTAVENMKLNGIDNLKIARLSALEVTQALRKEREFKRLQSIDIDMSDYSFGTLLIDPPRAGLQDEAALSFTAGFDRIIYISCGPESLASDLTYLTRTHDIKRLAFFDQFPYTHHLESGVLLERRK